MVSPLAVSAAPEVNDRRPGRSELPPKAKPKQHLNLSINLVNPPSRSVRYVCVSLFIFTNACNFLTFARCNETMLVTTVIRASKKVQIKEKKIKSSCVLQQYSLCALLHNRVRIEMLHFRGRDARLFPFVCVFRIA